MNTSELLLVPSLVFLAGASVGLTAKTAGFTVPFAQYVDRCARATSFVVLVLFLTGDIHDPLVTFVYVVFAGAAVAGVYADRQSRRSTSSLGTRSAAEIAGGFRVAERPAVPVATYPTWIAGDGSTVTQKTFRYGGRAASLSARTIKLLKADEAVVYTTRGSARFKSDTPLRSPGPGALVITDQRVLASPGRPAEPIEIHYGDLDSVTYQAGSPYSRLVLESRGVVLVVRALSSTSVVQLERASHEIEQRLRSDGR